MFSLMPKTTTTLSDLFDNFLSDPGNDQSGLLTSYVAKPAIDIEELNDRYVVKADIPGVSKEDIAITAEDGILKIKAERKEEKKEDSKRYRYYERRASLYERSFRLTDGLQTDKIEASLKDGVLLVNVPKKDKIITKNVEIK
jgi:HSP20 family protein